MTIATSIVDFDPEGDPASVEPHPMNARLHPEAQRVAMDESLTRVGWISAVIANRRTGRLLDGHERREEAIARGTTLPIMWVDIDEDDEAFVLATFDPIAALAEFDSSILAELVDIANIETVDLAGMLTDQIALIVGPPDLDDLADQYEPDSDAGSDPGSVWIRLEVSAETFDMWAEYRKRHPSDDVALSEAVS